MLQTPSIVVADDHPLFRDALADIVKTIYPGANVMTAEDLRTTIAALGTSSDIDLVLLDLNLPGVQGFSGLIFLRGQYPSIPIIIVSGDDSLDTIRRSIALGASGFVPKSSGSSTINKAIDAVSAGEIWVPDEAAFNSIEQDDVLFDIAARLSSLTPQQMRVLMMLKEGLLNKQIAFELSVSEATVKAHVSAILQKMDVSSRTQAVIMASKIASTN